MKWIVLCFVIAHLARGDESDRIRRGIIEQLNEGFYSGDKLGDVSTIYLKDSQDVMVNCSVYNTSVWISGSYLLSTAIVGVENIDKLVFVDNAGRPLPGCSGGVTINGFHFYLGYGACIKSREMDAVYITYNYTLCVIPSYESGVYISRDKSTTFEFSCKYERTLLTQSFPVPPAINQVVFQQVQTTGQFQINVNRYNDSTCQFQSNDSVVVVPQTVFIGFEINNGATTSLILQLHNCFATPTNNFNNPTRFNIISNGCPANDPSLPGSNVVYENFQSHRGKFSFRSFVWSMIPVIDQMVFIHCEVEVCESMIMDNNCTVAPNCVNRRRRSSLHGDTQYVSWGPATLHTQPQPCDEKSLGCSDGCSLNHLHQEICICPYGYMLMEDSKTCRNVLDDAVLKDDKGALEDDVSAPTDAQHNNYLRLALLALIGLLALFSVFLLFQGNQSSLPVAKTTDI